jgi:predicted dienelactone hydrolase
MTRPPRVIQRIAALLVALPLACALAAEPREERGPYPVQALDQQWTDAARNRTLPIRLRVPQAPGARPVVLFSHGLGGSIEGGRDWGEHWASHGFVVVHLQHPGSDETVWKDARRPAAALRRAASAGQLEARVQDVRFALDELARRKAAGDALLAPADLTRFGMSGHSFGAVTTQWLAGQTHWRRGAVGREDRIRAFIAFSPSAQAGQEGAFGKIERPFFSVTGTADGEVGMGLGVPPEQRLLPYAGMPAGDKYLLNLVEADHMLFNGGGRRERRIGAPGAPPDPARDARHTRLVQATTLAFWQATLLDDPAARAWLHSAAGYVGTDGEFRFK